MSGENTSAESRVTFDASRLRVDSGRRQIYDRLRMKWLDFTLEEYVRQIFVDWLITNKGFSPYRMANEVGISLNGTSRRCDTVVYNGERRPVMIIEYKAPSVKISQKTFDQIVRYNMTLKVDYLVVFNGSQCFCCKVDFEAGKCVFLNDIPTYDVISNE